MHMFEFELGQPVVIKVSGEKGIVVVGAAKYQYTENSFLVRYCAGDGRAVESWWTSAALTDGEVE